MYLHAAPLGTEGGEITFMRQKFGDFLAGATFLVGCACGAEKRKLSLLSKQSL